MYGEDRWNTRPNSRILRHNGSDRRHASGVSTAPRSSRCLRTGNVPGTGPSRAREPYAKGDSATRNVFHLPFANSRRLACPSSSPIHRQRHRHPHAAWIDGPDPRQRLLHQLPTGNNQVRQHLPGSDAIAGEGDCLLCLLSVHVSGILLSTSPHHDP